MHFKYLVKVGKLVGIEKTVGVGHISRYTGSYLYFKIRYKGKALNLSQI